MSACLAPVAAAGVSDTPRGLDPSPPEVHVPHFGIDTSAQSESEQRSSISAGLDAIHRQLTAVLAAQQWHCDQIDQLNRICISLQEQIECTQQLHFDTSCRLDTLSSGNFGSQGLAGQTSVFNAGPSAPQPVARAVAGCPDA